jgi:hypothetical protein
MSAPKKQYKFSNEAMPFKKRGCIAMFKVWPGRGTNIKQLKGYGGYYFHVAFFENKAWMRRAFHEIQRVRTDDDKDDRFGAIVMPMERQRYVKWQGKMQWKSDGCLGLVLFSKTQMGGETVAHECGHMATNFWLRAKPSYIDLLGEDGEKNDDEPLCYAIGHCMRQIVNAMHKYKLVK